MTLAPTWQREKDSNPHKQSQSLSCYPYTIPLYRLREQMILYLIFRICQAKFSIFFRRIF